MDERVNQTDQFSNSAARASMAEMPRTVMRNWQQNSVRLVRAQERLMHSFMQATQLQMAYTQNFWTQLGNVPAINRSEPGQQADKATAELERFSALLKEMMETMQRGLQEAMQLLLETAHATAQDAQTAAHQATDAAHDAAQHARNVAQTAADRTQQAFHETASQAQETFEQATNYGGNETANSNS